MSRVLVLAVMLVAAMAQAKRSSNVDQLTDSNWETMLEGEWMVEFYAPWCPACKALEPIWEKLAFQKKELGIDVGKIDVTESTGLSGRFMVTALPTIYHVKDGIFRQYKSPRDKDSLVNFVMKKTWMKVDPISSWKSPTSIQMSIVSQFFKVSQILRGVHTKLMDEYGLPTWGSYFIFAIATILLGGILGLMIVCIIDCIYPPKTYVTQKKKGETSGFMAEKTSDDDEEENIKDDLVDEGSEESGEKTDKDSKSSQPNSPNVRKRRSRKAD